jgi:hypothetical protein
MPPLLLNPTLWVLVLALALASWRSLGGRAGSNWAAAVASLLGTTPVLTALVLATALQLGWALYLGYEAPRDVMQDIVSAREYLDGRSMYPADATPRIGELLDAEPPAFSLSGYSTALAQQEEYERGLVRKFHWVQAHPPMTTLLVAGPVAVFGVRGTYLTVFLVSLGMLLATLAMLRRDLAPSLPWRPSLALTLLVVAWHPVLLTLRVGQSGLLMAALLALGWTSLRRGRTAMAGAAIGTAVCLKVYPVVVLLWLLLRHRRAFGAAMLTIAAVVGITWWIGGPASYPEFVSMVFYLMDTYGEHLVNLSLAGLLVRLLPAEWHHSVGKLVVPLLWGVAALVAALWLRRRQRTGSAASTPREIDLEFGAAVLWALLLSPIAWNHYLPVLLLPIALLGYWLVAAAARPAAMVAFLALLLLVSLPDEMPWQLVHMLQQLFGYRPSVFFAALPTFAMLGLAVWMQRSRPAASTR